MIYLDRRQLLINQGLTIQFGLDQALAFLLIPLPSLMHIWPSLPSSAEWQQGKGAMTFLHSCLKLNFCELFGWASSLVSS